MHQSMLEVRRLTVSYDETPVLRGVSFACGPGEIVGILGPNGAGKSTLIKAILGLVAVDAGDVRIDGGPVDSARRSVAYVPQRAEIDWDYPAIVREVVAMGRYVRRGVLRRLSPVDRAIITEAIERVGLDAYARAPIGELSGGQQQRVFLARALAQEAQILLLDEPFAGIDVLTEELLGERLRELREEGATILVVNHDLASVGRLYDQLCILARRVVAYGPTKEVFTAGHVAEAYGKVPEFLAGGRP